MEDNKIKIVFDKIIISIFWLLCIIGFFMIVCELPNMMNEVFNTTLFENTRIISFFLCIAILGYAIDYYQKQKDKKQFEITSKHTNELIGLNNFWKLFDYETTTITKMKITSFFKVGIIIKNKYSIQIPIELFVNIKTPKDLTKLDNYIEKYCDEKIEEQKQKIILEMRIENAIVDYLKNIN